MRSSARPRSPRCKKMDNATWQTELPSLHSSLAHGARAGQGQLDDLVRTWTPRIAGAARESEPLVLVDDTGCPFEPILQAPRWLCHTLALRHASAHVLLIWDSPKLGPTFVCQVRSWNKKDFPGRVDISVGGHVVGSTHSRQTALQEMKEELGLVPGDLSEPGLTFIGGYECFVTVEDRHFYDVEWRDVYLGTVSSLDALHFTDGEVVGIYLCPVSQALTLLTQQSISIANGLAMSLPLCLDYLNEGKVGSPG